MSSGTRREDATVVDNMDPDMRGRLRVKCPAVLGDDQAIEDWIEPTFPWAAPGLGWFFVPPVGAGVIIEFDEHTTGDQFDGEQFILNPSFRWTSCIYRTTQDVPEEFRDLAKYGQRLGLASSSGQFVIFDDSIGEMILKFGKLRIGADDAGNPFCLSDILQTILVVLFQAVQTWANAHVHATGTGPSGVPTPPLSLNLSDLQGTSWMSDMIFGTK